MTDRSLVLVLGDQLTPTLASLDCADPAKGVILMAEVCAEATYAWHHKKKLALVFSAMRHFAEELRTVGWTVDYRKLDPAQGFRSLKDAVHSAAAAHSATSVKITEPGEWRLKQDVESWAEDLGLPVYMLEDTRFVATHAEFEDWAEGRKSLRMEYFYRQMRRKTGLLMEGDKPAGGKWNYDAENRKPASADLFMPRLPMFEPDKITEDVLDLIERQFPEHPGCLRPFTYAATRTDAELARDHFIDACLPLFGDYQDAMLAGEPYLYHSVLSAYLNVGLLDPIDLCRRAEAAWQSGDAPLNAVEGFIRQIIGWREYIRGIYWHEGPEYT